MDKPAQSAPEPLPHDPPPPPYSSEHPGATSNEATPFVPSSSNHVYSPFADYYHTVSTQIQQPPEWNRFPLAAWMFLLGWAFPPLWFVGACCFLRSSNPFERAWAKVCLVVLLVSVVVGVFVAVGEIFRMM
ncbi:uncharacterized protein VTP21DRAFT_11280 [Calcarisporiella thermophila]|uniref:uncharacterized protein n=1 Tax=Calcarisporiella thermophila TaxID=911321 RepID=UPI0037439B05